MTTGPNGTYWVGLYGSSGSTARATDEMDGVLIISKEAGKETVAIRDKFNRGAK